MGFLGVIPGRSELIEKYGLRILKKAGQEAVKALKKLLDTPDERQQFAEWLNDKINIPILDEGEETEVFRNFVDVIYSSIEALDKFVNS